MNETAGRAPAKGVLAASVGYLVWGLSPLYWHLLAAVDADELIAHRLCWTMLLTVPLLAWRDGLKSTLAALASWRACGRNFLSAALLTTNWLVYVWAVNHGHVLESSLGYFLVPLVNVALGWGVLHERLRRLQWLAIGLAAAGVSVQLIQLGRLPWIALLIAGSFGVYGLLKKQSPLGPLAGLAVETSLLAVPAAAFLLWRAVSGSGALGHAPVATQGLVLITGVFTAVPLLLFAYGARRLRLTTLGLLQYIAPTAQFVLGIWYYRETFTPARAQSFALIWAGLLLYTFDAGWSQRHRAWRSLTPGRWPTIGS
jgi:chloramphenicol-sensitive protein RarD